ncbi:MAG: hypothetical protein R2718_06530 [Solirubrobacterales bacterium]
MSEPQNRITDLSELLGPAGPEVSCEECFELLDSYVDVELCGGDPNARLPGMRNHLAGCPACQEDFESLRDLAAEGPSPA